MTMGEYIKQLREKHQLTQEELGRLLGVNRDAVSKWEKGRVENIKRTTIKRMAELFKVSPCELMCFEPAEEKKECNLYDECYGSGTADIVDKLLRLDNEDRLKIAERIEVFLEAEKYEKRESEKAM